MIWATLTGSQTASIERDGSRSSRCESCWARVGSNSPDTDLVSSPRSTCSGRSSSEPDSSRERSSRSTDSLRRRSTCCLTWSRKRLRVSGSRSSSSSSSTNPPSEKIGVRSSCDAVAMNFLRASSSCLSWRCIWLKAIASCPSSSLESTCDRVVEVARRHLLGRELQPLDALAQRPRDEVAADQRQQQRDPAGDEDLVPHDLDAVHDVRDRVGVDDHRADPALVADGVGGLRNGPVARRLDARLGRARHRRLAGDAGTTAGWWPRACSSRPRARAAGRQVSERPRTASRGPGRRGPRRRHGRGRPTAARSTRSCR